jgi:hypothetical protein
MITCSGIRSHARAYGYGSAGTWVLEQVDAASDEPEYCATAWSLLRGTLATVDDATYAAAREVASAARGLSVWRDAWLAFVFPDEDWAASLVEPLLERAQTMGRTYSPMFARFVSVAPTAAARTLVTTLANKALVAADLVTLVAHRGPGAHEVLEAALAAATNKDGRTLVAHAMAAVGLKEPTAKRGPATKKRS